jgi:hypothetical protein
MGVNERVNIPPRDQFHSWGPEVKLRMALPLFVWNERSGMGSRAYGKIITSGLSLCQFPPNPLTTGLVEESHCCGITLGFES